MDELLAWSNKLCAELDINYAEHYRRVDQLVSAHRELSIKYDVLQSKFDHFVDEHRHPMQHFACGVVSCLAVFAGEPTFDLPFDVGAGGEPGAPFPPSSTGFRHPTPESIVQGGVPTIPSYYFSDAGVGLDSHESLPSLLFQSTNLTVPPTSPLSSLWDVVEPHSTYSQLDAGR